MFGNLGAYDLIKRNPSAKKFSIHRLVQAWVLKNMATDRWMKSFDIAVELLYNQFPQQALGMPLHEFHHICDVFLPHVLKLAKHYSDAAEQPPSSKKLAELLHNATWYARVRKSFSGH